MPKPQAIWTEFATENMVDIVLYVAQHNPVAALELEDLAYTGADNLAFMPFMGRKGRVEGTREYLFHPNYWLIYEVTDNGIRVLTVVHARQNYPYR